MQWGFNLFYERETGGARATEWGFSQAVGYSPLDIRFSVGVEMNFECTTEKNSRGDAEIEFLIGPSIQWRPSWRTHLDLVPLFGTTKDSPRVEAFIVFGIELGSGVESKETKVLHTCSIQPKPAMDRTLIPGAWLEIQRA